MLCDFIGNLFEFSCGNFTCAGTAGGPFEIGPGLAHTTICTHECSATMMVERSVEIWLTESLFTNWSSLFESDFELVPLVLGFASGKFSSPFYTKAKIGIGLFCRAVWC